MELWDLYDEHWQKTGETAVRGEKLPEGRYHLVVDVLFLNSKGETLLQRRAKEKENMPDIWSVAGGSVIAGENSAQGCAREVEEEMGFKPDMQNARVLMKEARVREKGGFLRDIWLIRQDVPIESMTWQPSEVQDGMWILPEKIRQDEKLWKEMNELYFWKHTYPYLCLESMRIRIPKGVYRHYKGNRYQVLGLCLHSETEQPMVIYKALYGFEEIWTRPAAMWNEQVTDAEGKTIPRFLLEKAD